MKKIILTASLAALMCNGAAAQQIQGDFDSDWEKCIPWDSKGNTKDSGTTPAGWTISNVQTAAGAQVVGTEVSSDGNKAVKLTNRELVGQKIPAYITLGTSWATAETKLTSVRNADGGTFGGKAFSYSPDAISFDYIRDNSKGTSESATVVAYLWKGTYTQKKVPGNTAVGVFGWGTATEVDMTDRDRQILGIETATGGDKSQTQDAALIAKLTQSINATEKWTHMEVPFTYIKGHETDGVEKVNVIFSANDYFGDRNSIVGGNSLTIDNVKFLYYHALTGLKFDGVAIDRSSEDTLSYNVPARVYDASKLTYTKIGARATVESSYDEKTALLTLTVKGNDYSVDNSSVTTYKVQFATSEATTYTNDLLIDQKGTDNTPMGKVLQPDTPIQLIKQSDGSSSFLLENFNFQGIPVGNIRVDNLTQAPQADGSVQYTGSGVVNVMGSPVNVSVDATVKGDQMTAVIDIPNAMNAFNITVTFAPSITLSGEETVGTLPEGRTIVALKRHFYQGWNSLCLPFDVTTDGFGTTVKAQAFTSASADGSQLNFTAATTLEAGKPYLVWFDNEQDLSADDATPLYFTSDALKADLTAVTYGNYTFKGNYTAHFDMEGRYGVADENGVQKLKVGNPGSYLYATGAYFTSTSAQAAGAVLNFDMQPTGIGSVEQQQTLDSPVYNLQGQKVSDNSLQGLPKGIYIQSGRKVIVR